MPGLGPWRPTVMALRIFAAFLAIVCFFYLDYNGLQNGEHADWPTEGLGHVISYAWLWVGLGAGLLLRSWSWSLVLPAAAAAAVALTVILGGPNHPWVDSGWEDDLVLGALLTVLAVAAGSALRRLPWGRLVSAVMPDARRAP